MQFTLCPEANVEILALANQTRIHPGSILASILYRGFETVHAEAQFFREIEVSMRPRAATPPTPSVCAISEPHPQHWRKALRFESSLDAEVAANTPIPVQCSNQEVRELPPVASHTWEFGSDRPTWIQTDYMHNGLAHWYLTNKVQVQGGGFAPRSTPPGCAIPIQPTAQSIVECLAEIQDSNWINKEQFLQALMPAIRTIAQAQSTI